MKKLIFTLSVLLSSTLVFSQSDSDVVQFGAKGGVNFSTISGDDFPEVDSRTSFNVGLFLEIPISDRFSFQPELFYSGQGFDIAEVDQDNPFDTDDNVEYQLDYIQIPMLIKAYLIGGLSVEAGPQLGIKINEEVDFEPNNDGGDVDIDDSNVRDLDVGLALGASYKFDGGLFLSARYAFGLSNLYKDNTVFEDIDASNSVLQFGLGFMF